MIVRSRSSKVASVLLVGVALSFVVVVVILWSSADDANDADTAPEQLEASPFGGASVPATVLDDPHHGRDANLLETGKRAASVLITNTNCTTVLGRVIDEAGCPIVGATVAEASVEELDLDATCPQGVAWTDTGVSSAVDGTVHLQVLRVQSAPVTLVPQLSFTQRVRRDPSKSSTRLCFYRWYGKVDNIAPGVFGFRDIVPGTFDLWIDVDGFASKEVEDIVVPELPGEAHVSVTLDAKRQITGTVRWPDGKSATGVRVLWELHRGDDQSARSRHVCFDGLGVRVRPDRSQGTAMLTDKRGAFAFRKLEKSGRYHLYLAVDGREIYTPPPVHVTTDNPQVDLDLTLPAADGVIDGCVFTGGNPLAGALVVAYNGEDLYRRVRTDEDGCYAITGLPDGRYAVDARALPARPTSANNHIVWVGIDDGPDTAQPMRSEPLSALISDAATVRLDLHINDPWNGTVAGVVDFGGLPPPVDMKVFLRPDRGTPGSRCADRPTAADLFYYENTLSDLDPTIAGYRFEHLCAGRYRVALAWDGTRRYRYCSQPLELFPSDCHEMIISLAFSRAAGIVLDKSTGRAISGAGVVLSPSCNEAQLDLRWEMTTDEEGRFCAREIPAAAYDLVIDHDDYAPHLERGVRLDTGLGRDDLCFQIVPGYVVKGRIVVAAGDTRTERGSLTNYTVSPKYHVSNLPWFHPGVNVADDGRFVVSGLPAGEVRLVVQRKDRHVPISIVRAKIVLPDAADTEVLIEIPVIR